MTQSQEMANNAEHNERPLSDAQRNRLKQAMVRSRKVNAAANVAAFNGWTLGLFAALSLAFFLISIPFGLSVVALLVGSGLAVTSYNEFRGRRQLRQFDLGGPRLLGANQLLLMAIIFGYCANQIYTAWTSSYDEYAQVIAQMPELEPMLNDSAIKATITLVYMMVALGSLLFQGINSLYYFSIRKHLRGYLQQTPPWVVELMRDLRG